MAILLPSKTAFRTTTALPRLASDGAAGIKQTALSSSYEVLHSQHDARSASFKIFVFRYDVRSADIELLRMSIALRYAR